MALISVYLVKKEVYRRKTMECVQKRRPVMSRRRRRAAAAATRPGDVYKQHPLMALCIAALHKRYCLFKSGAPHSNPKLD